MTEEMLDNRDFENEAPEQDVTPVEENNDAQPSESTEAVEPEETNDTEESTESDVEETTEKTQEEESVESGEESTPAESGEPSQPEVKTTRAQRRIQKLLAENKRLQEERQTSNEYFNPLQPAPNADGEVEMTTEQLQNYISSQVQNTLSKEREAQMMREKAAAWDEDINELMETTPELNPNSPQFNKELNDSLIELVCVSNVDDYGNPTVRKLPSEIWNNLNKTIKSAQTAATKDASTKLAKKSEEGAVQNVVDGTKEEEKYSDEQLEKLQRTNPRAYADLIENNPNLI